MRTRLLVIAVGGTVNLFFSLAANAAEPADNRMRDALRNALLQVRSCETEKAALQTGKAEAEELNKSLSAQVDSLGAKGAKADKAAAEQADQMAKLKEALGKWEVAYQQAIDLARKTEAERAKLSEKRIFLQREVEDQQRKNAALFKTGNEILTRYEHFGLGDALAAKEPFVGMTRVKLETLVQDYRDKLADQKIKP